MSEQLKENESSGIKSSPVVILVILTSLIVLVSFYGLSIMFQSDISKLKTEKEKATAIGTDLQNQKLYESEVLNELSWINRRAGTVKLPISRAKEIIVKQYNR